MAQKTYASRIAKPRKVHPPVNDDFIKKLYETGDADKAIAKIEKEQEQEQQRKEQEQEQQRKEQEQQGKEQEQQRKEQEQQRKEQNFEDFFIETPSTLNRQIRISEDLYNVISGLSYMRKTTKQAIVVNILEQWRATYKNEIKKEFRALMKQSI